MSGHEIDPRARAKYLGVGAVMDVAQAVALRVWPQHVEAIENLGDMLHSWLADQFHDSAAYPCDCDDHDEAPRAPASAPN